MSKGNMFVGSAKGRVGNLVLYTRKGSQITRAYQGDVKNPRTNTQMLQRAKFANAVKFYQKAVQHFFKFAYQDQKQSETSFNAFMRHNIDKSCLLRQDEVKDSYFPALGRWVMSQGSLASAFIPTFSGAVATFNNTGVEGTEVTIADVSNMLLGQGYHVGDVITFVMISSLVTSIDFDLSNYYDSGNLVQPQWDIRQFIVSTTDSTPITDIPRLGPSLGTLAVAKGGIKYTFNNGEYSNAAAVIVTRKGSGVTYSSNAELVPNMVTLAMLNATQTTAWSAEVAESWRAEGDAILHGSVADGSAATRSTGTSGTGTTGGSSTGGTTAASSITSINGVNQPLSINSAGSTAVTINGRNLSSTAPTATGTGISVTGFKISDDERTKATFNIVVASDFESGSVSYMGRTIASITKRGDGTGNNEDI